MSQKGAPRKGKKKRDRRTENFRCRDFSTLYREFDTQRDQRRMIVGEGEGGMKEGKERIEKVVINESQKR